MIHGKTTIKRRRRAASKGAVSALHNMAVLSYLSAFSELVTPPDYIKSRRMESDLVSRARDTLRIRADFHKAISGLDVYADRRKRA